MAKLSTKATAKPAQSTNRIWDFLVLWPFIYIFLLFFGGLMIALVSGAVFDQYSEPPVFLLALLPIIFILHLATIVNMFVTYVYAIHRLYTQSALDEDQKRTWLILVVLFNVITIPILHFMHLRR